MSVLDAFFNKGAFKAAKCKTLLKLTIPRIKLLRNRREIQIKQMRRDIAKLLETGQEATARIRVEHIIREENMMAAQEIIELFCELIVVRLPIIETQRECPLDLKEAISSACFAAPRCADLPELQQVQMLFASKYGKEFVAAASELMPDCGVNRQLIELLSIRAPPAHIKLKLLKEIAEEHELDWDPSASETEFLKPHEDLLNGPTQFISGSKLPIPKERHQISPPSSPVQDPHEQSDSDTGFDRLGFTEVPKVPLQPTVSTESAPPVVTPPLPDSADSGADDELRKYYGADDESRKYSGADDELRKYSGADDELRKYSGADDEVNKYSGADDEVNKYSGADDEVNKYSGADDEVNKYSGADDEVNKYSGADDEVKKYSGAEAELRKYSGADDEVKIHSGADDDLRKYSGADDELRKYSGGDDELRNYSGAYDEVRNYSGAYDERKKYSEADDALGKYSGADDDLGNYSGADDEQRKYSGRYDEQRNYSGGDELRKFSGADDDVGKYSGADDELRRYSGPYDEQRKYSGDKEEMRKYSGADDELGKYSGGDDELRKYSVANENLARQAHWESREVVTEPPNASSYESENISVFTGEENKQFLPFISPPAVSGASFSANQSKPAPSIFSTKSEANIDLQDVLAAAHAAADSAERAAAAARSAATLAEVRITELIKKRDGLASEDALNTFHKDSTDVGSNRGSVTYETLKIGDDPQISDDQVVEHGSTHNTPQQLTSMEDDPYFSYPNLFSRQNSNVTSDVHSSAEISPSTRGH